MNLRSDWEEWGVLGFGRWHCLKSLELKHPCLQVFLISPHSGWKIALLGPWAVRSEPKKCRKNKSISASWNFDQEHAAGTNEARNRQAEEAAASLGDGRRGSQRSSGGSRWQNFWLSEIFKKHLICFDLVTVSTFRHEHHERREVRNYHWKELVILLLNHWERKHERKKKTTKNNRASLINIKVMGALRRTAPHPLGMPLASKVRAGVETVNVPVPLSGFPIFGWTLPSSCEAHWSSHPSVVTKNEKELLFSCPVRCSAFTGDRSVYIARVFEPALPFLPKLAAVKARSVCYFVLFWESFDNSG